MNQKCQHSGCTCDHDEARMVQKNGIYYCSEQCASNPRGSGACSCGHPDCRGTSTADSGPR
ncbi:MAG: metallothionein [Acidobacteria bacterium]|nr:metallothionein [Acidobacteriota bacterium]